MSCEKAELAAEDAADVAPDATAAVSILFVPNVQIDGSICVLFCVGIWYKLIVFGILFPK